jgi:hypothetical protein
MTRAFPIPITPNLWTVLWESEHACGFHGWGISHAAAVILATRIELGEVVL